VAVERVAVVPQLHEDAVAPEGLDEAVERPPGGQGAVRRQGLGHGALAAAREHEPRVVGRALGRVEVDGRPRVVGQAGQRGPGRALLPRQLGPADGPGQAGVADGPLGQDDEVLAGRVGQPVGRLERRLTGRDERELGAEHRGQADLAGRLGEAHHAVEPVVVGQGQAGEAEAGGLLGQVLGVAGPVEEREVRVAVQLGVGDHRPHAPGAAGGGGGGRRRHTPSIANTRSPPSSARMPGFGG
jgi:hypothetical protein